MTAIQTGRNILFDLLGVLVLILKSHYTGRFSEGVHSYAGNFAVSFSIYFLAAIAASQVGLGRAAAAVGALLVVEAFEITNGFGVMSNTYDPVDLLANAAGIGFAILVDLATWRFVTSPVESN
jgi:hypothetical protein